MLVFPDMTNKIAAMFTRITLSHRRAAVVKTIGGYSLHGEHYRRLRVNEDQSYSQDEYMYVHRTVLSRLVDTSEMKAFILWTCIYSS